MGMDMHLHRTELISRLLDVYSERHRVIAQNVANVNTPHYHQLDVDFEDAFARAVAQHNPAALTRVRPTVVENDTGPERADGNNVDIDFEMSRLTKNDLLYHAFTQILASRVSTQRSAISGQ
jgi:flagellar basal-body rod protein FlgB